MFVKPFGFFLTSLDIIFPSDVRSLLKVRRRTINTNNLRQNLPEGARQFEAKSRLLMGIAWSVIDRNARNSDLFAFDLLFKDTIVAI
jgi:hypothetical protein